MTEEKKLDLKEAIGGKVENVTKRVSGKSWKVQKTPTHRAQMSKKLRKTWDQRTEERQKKEAIKTLEKQMKDQKQADKDRKREITLERKKIKEEKERLEQLAAKMSAKRIQRKRKRDSKRRAKV